MHFPVLLALIPTVLGLSQVPVDPNHHTSNELVSAFQVFQSEVSPNHFVRIKPQDASLCNTPVKQYTGWLDIGSKHLFFWYFEAENRPSSPDTQPLTLWLNGGPGASSLLGLFQELGPCLINEYGNGTVYNPYGWNKDTALLFVDQPAGVGFSYMDKDSGPFNDDSLKCAEDMQIFLQMFTTQVFPAHLNGPLVLTGESYGGHYLPTLGSQILRQNALYPTRPQLNLKSLAIGNAYVSPPDFTFGYYETLCTTNPGIPEPIFNETRCERILENIPRCLDLWTTCMGHPDPAVCKVADDICYGQIVGLYDDEAEKGPGSRNRYDITTPCKSENDLCYLASEAIEHYLNLPSTFSSLSIPFSFPKNFTLASDPVSAAFQHTLDIPRARVSDVKFLLSEQIDILIYSGNWDLACNTAGARKWMQEMNWKGSAMWSSELERGWKSSAVVVDRKGKGGNVVEKVKGEEAGEEMVVGTFKEVRVKMKKDSEKKTRLSFATIDGAGHLVPQDQPAVALDMITRWIKGEDFE